MALERHACPIDPRRVLIACPTSTHPAPWTRSLGIGQTPYIHLQTWRGEGGVKEEPLGPFQMTQQDSGVELDGHIDWDRSDSRCLMKHYLYKPPPPSTTNNTNTTFSTPLAVS